MESKMFIYCIYFSMLMLISCQELKISQSPTFITKAMGKTAKFSCEVEGISVIKHGLHVYQQDRNKRVKWLLFYKPSHQEIPDKYKNRISLDTQGDKSCTLSLTNINPDDDGTYFCAAWHIDT
ncbi:hypothetical protein XELAEV_18031261mg [Xenopus laevis]|uniref:Ig-like domain-containing protein n=1 Tax=Xenopus laevis TaxID=8355 RepID=A0A974CMF3_XENLA|nr:hypothetical protein XELAEV_18031261mg [Xenopus laevis]